MRRNWFLWLGSIMCFFLIVIMFAGPYIPFIDTELIPKRIIITDDEIISAPLPPSSDHLLGTDREGRDLLSLLVMGAKETILCILAVTVIRYVIAIILALLASKNKGPMFNFLKGWNQFFSGLPIVFSVILLINLPFLIFSENRFYWVILILALIEVGRVGFILQQRIHSISKAPFIDAAITMGIKPLGIYTSYYLPNLVPDIIVNFFVDIGRAALLVGQLGIFSIFINQDFILLEGGSGLLVNSSLNWATLLGESRGDILRSFWIPFFPALAITITIFTFNMFGEGLRQQFAKKGQFY